MCPFTDGRRDSRLFKLVVKHTFIAVEYRREESATLRREKSEPLFDHSMAPRSLAPHGSELPKLEYSEASLEREIRCSFGISSPRSSGAGALRSCVQHKQGTTIMLANLQRNLSQPALVEDLTNAGYKGLFDFLYMPMNFRKSGNFTTNFGYAFINFRSSADAADFVSMLHHGVIPCSRLEEVTAEWSECQGLQANVRKFRNSPLMHKSIPADCKPAMYDLSGDRVSFPKPTKAIPRPRIRRQSESKLCDEEPIDCSADCQPCEECV